MTADAHHENIEHGGGNNSLMGRRAKLAWDTIFQQPTQGIPSWLLNIMQHSYIDRLAGVEPGAYRRDPERVYIQMQNAIGTCLLDQYIPDNPLSMGDTGYEEEADMRSSATAGVEQVVLDGIRITSPEAVVMHLEQYEFPRIQSAIAGFDEENLVKTILEDERVIQEKLGNDILKCPYGIVLFPYLAYYQYGYVPYFSAYGLYPEVIERHFSLQADYAQLNNRAAAKAILEGNLPPLCRLDHDMADSRGTLVSIASLEKIWFPHFSRSLEPLRKTGIRLIWHCDGNLMQMVPRLLEAGLHGFQGFQYEDGMDYESICRMKTRDGENLIIIAGVSVTRTLPFGKPSDVKREMEWLVKNGPPSGLFLGGSSSIAPGVPWENIVTLVEGLKFYQTFTRN